MRRGRRVRSHGEPLVSVWTRYGVEACVRREVLPKGREGGAGVRELEVGGVLAGEAEAEEGRRVKRLVGRLSG